jgi:hypothetical protein
MKRTFAVIALSILCNSLKAQNVAVNNNGSLADPSAMLHVQSTSKGFLTPRVTGSERAAIVNPANGLLVYDTDSKSFWHYKTGNGWLDMSKIQFPYAETSDYAGFAFYVNNINNTTSNTAIAAYSSNGVSLRAVNTGANAVALHAQSFNGIAGNFFGKVQVLHNSGLTSPQLLLEEGTSNNYSRLSFKNTNTSRQWTIAALNSLAGSASDRLNFYHSTTGDILSVSGDGKVVIGGVTAANNAKLDVQGGNINTDGKVTRNATGVANLVPLAYGTVHYSGTIYNSTGNFTSAVSGAVTTISVREKTSLLELT